MAIYMWREYVPRTFTISWTEKSDMSSWWTYSDDATWLTAGSTDFDEFFWYSWVRLNTSWVETDEITQSDSWWAGKLDITQLWTLTSGDNVMIKFPLRWIKMTKSWSVVTLSITEDPNKDGYQYYAHCTWTLSSPWTPKDQFYLWAYKWYTSSSVLKSWSWQMPTSSQTQATFCTRAKANGSGYNIIWFYQRQFVNCLYMMKYGNPNCQSVVWQWNTSPYYSSRLNSWWTNSQTNATYWTSSDTQQSKLFWLEDRWGNFREFIWGAYTDWNRKLYTQLSWYSWTLTWWEYTWVNTSYNYNELSSIVWDNKALFYPTATTGNWNYDTYYCDASYIGINNLLYTGGSWSEWTAGGIFFQSGTSWSWTDVSIGSRLLYL